MGRCGSGLLALLRVAVAEVIMLRGDVVGNVFGVVPYLSYKSAPQKTRYRPPVMPGVLYVRISRLSSCG